MFRIPSPFAQEGGLEFRNDAGIFDHRVVLADRTIAARPGHITIDLMDGEFVCKIVTGITGIALNCLDSRPAETPCPFVLPTRHN